MGSQAVQVLGGLVDRVLGERPASALRQGRIAVTAFLTDKSTDEVRALYHEVAADLQGLVGELASSLAELREESAKREARHRADRRGEFGDDLFSDLRDARERRLVAYLKPLHDKYGPRPPLELEKHIAGVQRAIGYVLQERWRREGEPKNLQTTKRKYTAAAVARADAEKAVQDEQRRRMAMRGAGVFAEDTLPKLHEAAQQAGAEVERLRAELLREFAVEVSA